MGRTRQRADIGRYTGAAQRSLTRFRHASRLALALTAMLLLVGRPGGAERPADAPGDPAASVEEATGLLRSLFQEMYAYLPKIVIAVAILALGIGMARLLRRMVAVWSGRWPRSQGINALVTLALYLISIGAALSVLAGDVGALVGSLGLAGLALSWSLQSPIESFTGWLVNSFKGYYRVGDRIEVGDVFGDVYQIDMLNTLVWEAGGPDKPVQGAQPTGALITFPNSEVLRANIINYTSDFPYVWDEVVQGVANETNLQYAVRVVRGVAERVLGQEMASASQQYQDLLRSRGLLYEIAEEPSVFVSLTDSWVNLTVRYLVDPRARRATATRLLLEIADEIARPQHAGKIFPAYPRSEVKFVPGAYESAPSRMNGSR
jgi:small-conductance mechanosensitive channel